MEIKLFSDLSKSDQEVVDQIFFESSAVKEFSSEEAKIEFRFKYLDYYKQFHSNFFLVAYDEKVLGYICGLVDTSSESELNKLTPHLKIFENDYHKFPAHLHINLHHESRGRGIGHELVDSFCEKLMKQGVKGVNIITAPDARNVNFYTKCDFNYRNRYTQGNIDLLLMGKRLES